MAKKISPAEARRRMMEADRDRGRIVYAYPDGLTEKQEREFMERAAQTPEYREADRRFRKYSAMVGSKGPEALRRMFS
jgi:hypothetical protein